MEKKGKLRGRNLLSRIFNMDSIISKLDSTKRFQPVCARLSSILTPEIFDPLSSNVYNTLPLEQKIAAARALDDAIYKFLAILSEEVPEAQTARN